MPRERITDTWETWIEAFGIFARYTHIPHVAVEHDIIYAGSDPDLVSTEDRERLEQLGWFPAGQFGCFQKFV
jgi:hypothetical protein